MDDYSISSISSDSAPRPINDRPTVPLIPLTIGQYYRHFFNKPPSVERDFSLFEYPITLLVPITFERLKLGT